MSTELAEFSDAWLDKVHELFFPKLPKQEAAIFKELCRLRKLNPYTKQVYFLPYEDRKNKRTNYTTIVSIDGFRTIAARTGLYEGQDEPIFNHDGNGKLVSVTQAVWRKGVARPTVAVAFLEEYQEWKTDWETKKRVLTDVWSRRPKGQLAKCAEALALRKAFPEDLSGLYEEAEMGNVIDSEAIRTEEPQAPVKSRAEAMAKKFAPKTIDAGVMPSGIRLAKSMGEIGGTRGGSWVDPSTMSGDQKRMMQKVNHDMGDIFKQPEAVGKDGEERFVKGMSELIGAMAASGLFPDEPPPPTDDDAPRAEEDASNTATLESYAEKVKRSLGGKTESITPTDGVYVFDFGKFRGKKASELDDGALKWMISNLSNRPEALEAAREEIKARHKL